MQDRSNTSINEGASGKIADKNLGGIGPFTSSDIESVARQCVADIDLEWDKLSAEAKAQYLEVARNVLTDTKNGEHLDGLIGGTPEGMRAFRRSIIREFRNSPKWDEDQFNSGWKVSEPIGSGTGSGEGGTDTTGG